MLDMPQTCKCLDQEDKKLMLKIIDEAIEEENKELKKIEARRMFSMMKPPFVEPFKGIRSSLKRVHEEFKKNVEELRKRVEQYPKCSGMPHLQTQSPTTKTGTNFKG